MSILLEGQVALANVQPLSTMDIFQQRASRGGVLPGLAAKLPWATSPQSPALDRPSSLLGKAASVGGPHTVLHRRTSGELLYLWSEHRPAEDKTLERPE